jgi:hypothetical protein
MKMNRWIFVVIASLMIVSCKVEIIVSEGGSVMSSSGAYNCAAGKTCTIDVVDLFFDETFTAVPANGYEFSSWKKRDDGFFGGETSPSVRLYTSDFSTFPVLLTFLETDNVFYLEPNFALPSPSTISIAGNWATTVSYDICSNDITADYSTVEASFSGGVYTFSETYIEDIAWNGDVGRLCYASDVDVVESGQFSGPEFYTPEGLASLVGEGENFIVVINSADQFTLTAQVRLGASNEVIVTYTQVWTRQ